MIVAAIAEKTEMKMLFFNVNQTSDELSMEVTFPRVNRPDHVYVDRLAHKRIKKKKKMVRKT